MEATLRYIVLVGQDKPPQSIYTLIAEKLSPQMEENLMTWAEQLRQEGEQKVQAQHLALARQRVLKMLQLKFQTLTPEQTAAVNAADADTLERWTIEILTASSIEALLAGQPS